MTEALTVRNLSHSFGGLCVISDVSLDVAPGEFVSIVGPSGSGKSTLFHLIGGLLTATEGEISVYGEPVRRGRIGYMPQQPALMPWRTVEANVVLAQEINGKPDLALAREWLARAGLDGFARSYPHQLSGGMQQRVAFLRALLSDQPLLCLDEPFSSLDAMTRIEMHRWLLDIWDTELPRGGEHPDRPVQRRSVLFVTHNIEEALLLSDTVHVFSHRPATILEKITVPFGRPRRDDVVDDPEFVKLRRRLTDLLTGPPR